MARECVAHRWSRRRLEQVLAEALNPLHGDADMTFLQTQLQDYLGAPVEIVTDNRERGEIRIRFFSYEEASGILERILPAEQGDRW